MTDHLVPAGFGEAEYTDKKSRFISRVWYVADEAEALERIAAVRAEHPDATHNVYAYSVRGGATRFSDDGEPGGTSGMPTLNVFRTQGIENYCCVTTRYFGGILLGSGGLVRAYSKAASMALEVAGVAEMQKWERVSVRCAYPLFERLKRLAAQWEAEEENSEFSEDVCVTFLCRTENVGGFKSAVTELSNAAAQFDTVGETLRPVRVK